VFLQLATGCRRSDVLAALGRVDELEALTRVGRRERGQMVRYGTAVAIVPVFDPGHRLTAGKVLHLGSATQLRRRQPDIIASVPTPGKLGLVEVHSGGRSSAASAPRQRQSLAPLLLRRRRRARAKAREVALQPAVEQAGARPG
jgi:hypothetical protein